MTSVDQPDDDLEDRIRRAVSHIGNEPAPALRVSRRRRRNRGPLAAAAAVVLIALVAVAAVIAIDSDDQVSAITPGLLRFEPIDGTVEELMTEMAQVALAAPAPGPDDVQYGLREIWDLDIVVGETAFEDTATTLRASIEETWIEPGQRATVETRPGRELEPGEVTDSYVPPSGEPETRRSTAQHNAGLATNVPDDPDAVITLETLGVGDDGSGDVLLFETIAGVLSITRLTANQKAALWNNLATNPALEILGTTTDRVGRPGVAVAAETAASGAATRTVFVFDPATAQPLAIERVLLEEPALVDIPTPALVGYETNVASTSVDAVGERPR